MWEKAFEVFIGKALDRVLKERTPRKKLARAFVDLYDSINCCHEAWFRGFTTPVSDWAFAIERLSRSIKQLTIVLDIHEPELLNILQDYHDTETAGLLTTRVDGRLSKYDVAAAFIFQRIRETDNNERERQRYDHVMKELKEFIRDKLKLTPEDLLDV